VGCIFNSVGLFITRVVGTLHILSENVRETYYMQVNTVQVGLSIAKSHYVACHYLQNIITEPKN
jgi:hypothetical protein